MIVRLAALTALTMLAACATDHQVRGSLPPGARYVAMGSSFAAGAAIGPLQPGSPERCSRTVNNYAVLTAQALRLALTDVSCGGATTANVLASWSELPAQIDALDPTTRLVTITIGGNDVNYVGNLFMATCPTGETVTVGTYKIPCSAPSAPDEAAYQRLEQSLDAIAQEVRRRSPAARLVFVQYLTLVPAKPCAAAPLPQRYAERNRNIGYRLAVITARVAVNNHAVLLDMGKLSHGHTPCDANPWANGMPHGFDLSHGAPWHPNAAGHRAIANALIRMLAR